MKKFQLLFLFLIIKTTAFCNSFSANDSVIYYLHQVKGLSQTDTFLLENISRNLLSAHPDSLKYNTIESELHQLIPVITIKNYLSLKTVLNQCFDYSINYNEAIDFSKLFIAELKNYNDEHTKDLLLTTLASARFPFRNSSRIYDGISYFRQLANDFEYANEPNEASICYYDLAGFHRALGLIEKAVYYELKSASILNCNEMVKAQQNFLIHNYENIGVLGCLNRKVVIGGMLNENDEPLRALPYLYEAKTIYDDIKDTIDASDAPYIYLQLTRAKLATNGDSAAYFLDLFKNSFDTAQNVTYFTMFCQIKSQYLYLNNQLDSATYFIQKAEQLKVQYHLMINTFSGFILDGYYLALIKAKQNKFDDAIKLLNNECNALIKINLRRVVLKEWMLLASIYKSKGDFKNATATLEKHNALLQQIIIDENKSRSLSFEAEQQINSLNAQKQTQEQEIRRQKLIRNWSIAGLGLVILFAGIFFRQRNKTRREKVRAENTLLDLKSTQLQLIQSEKLAAFGTVATRMAHEIQNPLNFVNNFSELSYELIDEAANSKTEEEKSEALSMLKENLEKINQHGKRASSIVKQLQEHSNKGTAHAFFEGGEK